MAFLLRFMVLVVAAAAEAENEKCLEASKVDKSVEGTGTGEVTLTETCGVRSTKEATETKELNAKAFDCEGQCPVAQYGKLYDQCCTLCGEYIDRGEHFFGVCPTCPVTSTFEQVVDYSLATSKGSTRRLNKDEVVDSVLARVLQQDHSFTAGCSVGKTEKGTMPKIMVKRMPCACEDVPILQQQCCDKCQRLAEACNSFWICEGCQGAYGKEAATNRLSDRLRSEFQKLNMTFSEGVASLTSPPALLAMPILWLGLAHFAL